MVWFSGLCQGIYAPQESHNLSGLIVSGNPVILELSG